MPISIIQTLNTIFTLIFIGVFCGRRKIFNDNQINGFEVFLFKIGLPSYLFSTTIQYDNHYLLDMEYITSYILTFLIVSIVTFLCFKNIDSLAKISIRILATGYINAAIYTLPIISFVLGNPRTAIIGNLVQVILIQSVFIVILGLLKHKENRIMYRVLRSILNPLIIAPVLGFSMNYFELLLPQFLGIAISKIGTGTSALALFTLGLNISNVTFSKDILNKTVITIVAIKNILHPVVAFILGSYILELDQYRLFSLVIAASAPTAFVVYIIAKEFDTESDIIQKVVVLTSIVSLFSLIFILSLL